jgi:hypothetical protein
VSVFRSCQQEGDVSGMSADSRRDGSGAQACNARIDMGRRHTMGDSIFPAVRFGERDAEEALDQAIDALRTAASPYHLAHGLLDHAAFLARTGDAEGAAAATNEAKTIGTRLRCPPLIRRAEALAEQRAGIA